MVYAQFRYLAGGVTLGVNVQVQLPSLTIIDFLSAEYESSLVARAPVAILIGEGTAIDCTLTEPTAQVCSRPKRTHRDALHASMLLQSRHAIIRPAWPRSQWRRRIYLSTTWSATLLQLSWLEVSSNRKWTPP